MRNTYIWGVAFLFALLLAVSPVQAQNLLVVNDTSLTVWDDSDSQDVYVFKPITFYANYTNSTSSDPISTNCTLIQDYNGSWSEPINMSYSNGTYSYSKSFVYPGTYWFEVTCEGINNPEGEVVYEGLTLSDEWTYQNPPERACSLDAFFTLNSAGYPVPKFKNTGNWYEEVSYEVSVGGTVQKNGTETLEAGEVLSVPFDWVGGTHKITLEASTDCGYSDKEVMTFGHQGIEYYSCQYPFGYEGENYCDYQNQEVLVCSGGDWEDTDLDYCTECPGTCGDGTINCGETLQSCPYDARATSGWLDDYRCMGDILQRKRLSWNHAFEWVDFRQCPYGCSGNACAPRCGIEILEFKHSDRFTTAQTAHATVTFRNTGEAQTGGNVKLYRDGSLWETKSFSGLDADEETTRTFYFSSPRGDHTISVLVTVNCGKSDSTDESGITVYQAVSAHVDPYGQANVLQPLETDAWVTQNSLDMAVGTSRTIAVHMQSSEPQAFEIEVSGVPDDWVSYTPVTDVDRRDTTYIYLTGKEQGSRAMEIKVTAKKENLVFTHSLDIYAGPDEAQEPVLFDFSAAFSGLMAMGEGQVIVGLALVAIILALFLGTLRLREPDIWEDDYPHNQHK